MQLTLKTIVFTSVGVLTFFMTLLSFRYEQLINKGIRNLPAPEQEKVNAIIDDENTTHAQAIRTLYQLNYRQIANAYRTKLILENLGIAGFTLFVLLVLISLFVKW